MDVCGRAVRFLRTARTFADGCGYAGSSFARLQSRPVITAIVGGVVIGLIGSFLPLALYSGQEQVIHITHNPTAYSVSFLLLLVVAKALLTSTSFDSGMPTWLGRGGSAARESPIPARGDSLG
jgi:H+/Cl- antiporter ClcA